MSKHIFLDNWVYSNLTNTEGDRALLDPHTVLPEQDAVLLAVLKQWLEIC